MTATHDSGATRPARWLDGLKRTRFVLAAAALAFGALWLLGAIHAAPALAGFALIAAAVLIATASAETTPALLPRDEPRAPRIGDPLIEAVLAGLPGPGVARGPRGGAGALQVGARTGAGGVGLARAAGAGGAGGDPPRARERDIPARRILPARAVRPLVRSHRDPDIVERGRLQAGPPAACVPRSHAVAAGRGDARRLHCQCQPRAAHAAC